MNKHLILALWIALMTFTNAHANDPLVDFHPSDAVAKHSDLVAAMTEFYSALAQSDLQTAERFVAPAPDNWRNPQRRIHDLLERRAGAKRFISFGWAPADTDADASAWIVSGVFVDSDGILFLREDASGRKVIKDCSFTDVWIRYDNRWLVIDASFFRLDISDYVKQLGEANQKEP